MARSAGVEVEGLVKHYGSRIALDGISFAIEPGEIVGLLGPNGAGKSTTISILATLLRADRGRVSVAGHALPAQARRVRRALGLVPQQTAVYPSLTARENLTFFGCMQGLTRREARRATESALELVGLEKRADEPVERFSGGMRRRLTLACGVLHAPSVLLLDEPTVGVDPQSRERIFTAVEALAARGAAILYSTHDMEEAERLARRVVLLDLGRIVALGTPAELVTRLEMALRIHLRAARPLPDGWLADVAGARLVESEGAGANYVVEVADGTAAPPVIAAATRAGGDLVDLTLHRPNLADVFFALTGRGLREDDGSRGEAA
jgi:ABC-2 type transport system ATP-binding protein